jgi:hypothetical protein
MRAYLRQNIKYRLRDPLGFCEELDHILPRVREDNVLDSKDEPYFLDPITELDGQDPRVHKSVV